jgi:ABC-type glycerol-3-phosphate transport system substrate-binding protein
MKNMSLTILLALLSVLFLGACSDNDAPFPRVQPPPPPVPLTWDQANWDEVVWQ